MSSGSLSGGFPEVSSKTQGERGRIRSTCQGGGEKRDPQAVAGGEKGRATERSELPRKRINFLSKVFYADAAIRRRGTGNAS